MQRDKEMTTFLDGFEAAQKEAMEANTTSELTIIGLLEHIRYDFYSDLFYFFNYDTIQFNNHFFSFLFFLVDIWQVNKVCPLNQLLNK